MATYPEDSSVDSLHSDFPWLRGPSIYRHIRAHLDPITGELTDAGNVLPDDERRAAGMRLRWVSGAMDGVLASPPVGDPPDRVMQIASQAVAIARTHSESAQRTLYHLLVEDGLINIIDLVIDEINRFGVTLQPYLVDYASRLAENAPDTGAVKFAIAMLGLCGNTAAIELVSVLGRHEEFTLYACVALARLTESPDDALWRLAQKVHGWGRIQSVRCLSNSASPDIKSWLLREGYRNNIMYGYLALECAVKGGLAESLAADEIDDELLISAGEILSAMTEDGPFDKLDDYADARYVVGRYLDHLESRASNLEHFNSALSIWRYLYLEDWAEEEVRQKRERNGWNRVNYLDAFETLKRIFRSPHWIPCIQEGLNSSDEHQFFLAIQAADFMHLDTWNVLWNRLVADPLQSHRWFPVMQRATADNIDQIVDFAVHALPLEQVAIGPANEVGLGPAYRVHSFLDFILQGLRDFPGKGWPLIAAALKSPVVRNRNFALRVMAGWPLELRTVEVERALSEALKVEPRDDVKARIEKVLHGESLD
jgi:hypothetical protein